MPTPAPPLAGPTDQGDFDLSAHRGRPAVVYFYPKDMTPGCTTEACDFRDRFDALTALGVLLVGVSPDAPRRHAAFREKYGLNFTLVSDPDSRICTAWGVWREKQNYGRTYMGVVRSTFLLDAQHQLVQQWENVRVKGHAEAVLSAARALPR